MKQIITSLTFISLLFNCVTSYAKDYQVEVLIFENQKTSRTYENNNYQPPKEMHSASEHWFVAPNLLTEPAKNLSDSDNYRLLNTLSWGQKSLPLSKAAAYQVAEKEANGWIKVYANDLLFVHLDIDVNGYRMTEKRRLKLNEKHFFDHPKFGVLLQVSRLAKAAPEELPKKALQGSK